MDEAGVPPADAPPPTNPEEPNVGYPPTNPDQPAAGYPPKNPDQPDAAHPPTNPGQPAVGYPPTNPGQPAAGYPPVNPGQPAAGYPPVNPGQPAAGYPPGQPAGAYPLGFTGALASNLPPREVMWMPAPTSTPTGCPPGLEYLTQVDQILVNQQIELIELVTNFETENKYRIRNTLGQQIYFAAEKSSAFQRQCCGPGREFSMSITDNSQREVIHLERPLRYCSGALCYCCCSCCMPHVIEVQSPPGTVIGYVKQEALGILRPWFSIQNADEETILRIRGPILGCSCYSDTNFCVLSADATQEVGKISKQWSGLAKEYFTDADNFGIQFPMDLDVKMKAVMIGACFLIDFMFFESAGANNNNNRRRRY